MARDLRDKVIAVTGGSSGIGAAVAVECAKAGMHVALGARRLDQLEEVARLVREHGVRALVVRCDVDQDGDVQSFIDATVAEFGRLDVMYANAGYGLFAPVVGTSDDEGRRIFETNFWGTVRCVRAAVPVMRRQKSGHIVICSSAASEVAPPMYGFYGATKAAQQSIAQALRAELSVENIDVTSVHPVGTETGFFKAVRSSHYAQFEKGHGGTPKNMVQSAEYVAKSIVRALRKPKAEVWPHVGARVGIAIGTLFPGLPAWALKKHMRQLKRELPAASHDEAAVPGAEPAGGASR